MQASLPMYSYPHLDGANRLFWNLIKANLRQSGVEAPETLSINSDSLKFWKAPETVFSQTCGMPYRTELHRDVQLVGTPDYGIEGCPPGYYCSVIVKRKAENWSRLADFEGARVAINGYNSQSGFAAIASEIKNMDIRFSECVITGSHKMSVNAVAADAADIAAIDAISWRLLVECDDVTDELDVIHNTEPTPGLPFICSNAIDRTLIHDAVADAIEALPQSSLDALLIRGLVDISSDIYMSVPTPVRGEAALIR